MVVDPDDPSCRELVELVTDYLEDSLPPAVRTRFEMHLAWPANCSRPERRPRSPGSGDGAV